MPSLISSNVNCLLRKVFRADIYFRQVVDADRTIAVQWTSSHRRRWLRSRSACHLQHCVEWGTEDYLTAGAELEPCMTS